MKLADLIYERLSAALKPQHMEVINESHMHSRGQETHFKVIVVSSQFEQKRAVQRQQLVYTAVKDLFAQGLHALSQAVFTPGEWAQSGAKAINPSPTCAGKSKSAGKC